CTSPFSEYQEKLWNPSGFGVTVAAKAGVRVLCRSGFCGLEPACSRTVRTAAAFEAWRFTVNAQEKE
ncbi:MAG TPA: hypothetical protein VF508_07915, partial [Pyrinomonadaceae bacterium]